MTDTVTRVHDLLSARLREIEAERAQLKRALKSLGPRPRPRASKRSSGMRAKRGERQAQFLAAVTARPGEPISAVAEQLGVAPQQLYPIARRLEASKQIRRQGKGFAAAASAATPSPPSP